MTTFGCGVPGDHRRYRFIVATTCSLTTIYEDVSSLNRSAPARAGKALRWPKRAARRQLDLSLHDVASVNESNTEITSRRFRESYNRFCEVFSPSTASSSYEGSKIRKSERSFLENTIEIRRFS